MRTGRQAPSARGLAPQRAQHTPFRPLGRRARKFARASLTIKIVGCTLKTILLVTEVQMPRRFDLEVRGHLFSFQVLKSGGLRVAGIDGRWNDRLDGARRMCSTQAWEEARERALAIVGGDAERVAPRPVMPALPPRVRARRGGVQ